MKKPKIVVIGGGTGSFTVLSGLKKFDYNLSAVVSMADDGGSTGVLRDELGALPPGDIRQCLVALSRSSKTMRELFNYRFEKGTFGGHNMGNLFLSALEKIYGSFEKAVLKASDILAISGNVIPVTINDTHLCLRLKNGRVIQGQYKIDNSFFSENQDFIELFLKPKAILNPRAKKAILESDLIVVGPGSFYTSIIPNLLVKGMPEALKKSKAVKIYICNLVNKPGQTDGFSIEDYIKHTEKFIGKPIFDFVIFNSKRPSEKVLAKYKEEGGNLVNIKVSNNVKSKLVSDDLISRKIPKVNSTDLMKRDLIRHNPQKLAGIIKDIYEGKI